MWLFTPDTRTGAACGRGTVLFAAMVQAWQRLVGRRVLMPGDEYWTVYAVARDAYLDHLRGWQEGDMKVQREIGMWMLYTRCCGQWVLQFATREERCVMDWLNGRRYQQCVRATAQRHWLAGYYRQAQPEVVPSVSHRYDREQKQH